MTIEEISATPNQFKLEILRALYQDLAEQQSDNFAPERFNLNGVDCSELFLIDRHVGFLDWFTRRYESIFFASRCFADRKSRELYLEILRYRLAGHLHVRINADAARVGERRAAFHAAFTGSPSILGTTGMFGGLMHFDAEWEGVTYAIDSVGYELAAALVYKQYFFERDGIVIRPEPGDVVIDGGAFTGETSVIFGTSVGPSGHVYAFDPVGDHIDICRHNFAQAKLTNVTLVERGLSDRTLDAPPVRVGQYSPGWHVDGSTVPLWRIDDFVRANALATVDFIKMDVEGSEIPALRGARETIARFRPKLAISIYHRPDDFCDIILLLQSFDLGYRFSLDHYTIFDEETVLYAMCPDRHAQRSE